VPLCDCHGHVDPGRDEALVVDRVGRAAEGLAHEAVGRHRLDDDQSERGQVGWREAGVGEARGQPIDDLVVGACHEARVELVEQLGR
jgi:hypothetical protein